MTTKVKLLEIEGDNNPKETSIKEVDEDMFVGIVSGLVEQRTGVESRFCLIVLTESEDGNTKVTVHGNSDPEDTPEILRDIADKFDEGKTIKKVTED